MPATLNKTQSTAVIDAYAEAWRNKQVADKVLKDQAENMQKILEGGPVAYTYADGAVVDFKLVSGERVDPVTYAEAKELTGFGEANMAKIAGKVDADAVKALAKLGKIGADLLAKLIPTKGYKQIRPTFRKDA